MLCERCRADISSEPLPPELEAIVGPFETVSRNVLEVLWRNREHSVSTERLIAVVYRGAEPQTAARSLSVTIYRLRRRLPSGYRIVGKHWHGVSLQRGDFPAFRPPIQRRKAIKALTERRREQARELREAGKLYREIGTELGVSMQRARGLYCEAKNPGYDSRK